MRALIVTVRVLPGTRDAFVARAAIHAQACLAEEPGCSRFDVVVPESCDDTVILYEVYDDDAALEAHRATDRIKAFFDDINPMMAERTRTLCDVVDTAAVAQAPAR